MMQETHYDALIFNSNSLTLTHANLLNKKLSSAVSTAKYNIKAAKSSRVIPGSWYVLFKLQHTVFKQGRICKHATGRNSGETDWTIAIIQI